MGKLVTGIHHVTAMAASAQKNLDFYAGDSWVENDKEDCKLRCA
jgi:catechol 2,3-dioxygenase-like lactoylglutathione lyase family enzyme